MVVIYQEEYDPATDTWTTKADMPTARAVLGVVEVNGKIYAIGGSSGNTSAVEEYDPETDTWTTKADMPTGRYGLGVVEVNGKIYAIGGYDGYLSTVEEYNPATDTWTTKADMPTARAHLGAAEVNGKIYAIGGYNGGFLSTVEEYNPTTDTWTTKEDMPTARNRLGVVEASGKIYAIGGYNNSNGSLSTVEVFSPPTSSDNASITVESPNTEVKINEEFTTDIVLNNSTDILAEDIKITYDTTLFEFIGYEEVTGLNVYHLDHDDTTGTIRTIIASEGKDNAVNSTTAPLLSLKFKAIGEGEGKIDAISARIATTEDEWDLLEEECYEITITVISSDYQDVNRSGEFTLIDLAIDAYYYNDFESVDTSKYDADVVIDNKIDDLDLSAIVSEILANDR